jgi:hypothetical protein
MHFDTRKQPDAVFDDVSVTVILYAIGNMLPLGFLRTACQANSHCQLEVDADFRTDVVTIGILEVAFHARAMTWSAS